MADEPSSGRVLSEAQRKEIFAALEKRGVPRGCPMCGTNKWWIGDGYYDNALHEYFKAFTLNGIGIPSVAIICENCGFISQHLLGALGFGSREPGAEKK